MNKLKITLKEDGSISQFAPDFKIMRGSYRNVLINIEVPRSLLIDTVEDEGNIPQAGNCVRIGGLIHTVTGKNLQTKRYELKWVKDYTLNNREYSLYQRIMPKEFTLWDTLNPYEANSGGKLDMAINIVNWVSNDGKHKIEEVAASDKISLPIHPSAYLEEAEDIESPSDFDLLQSQVQDVARDFTQFKTEYENYINAWYIKQKAEFDKRFDKQQENFDEEFEKLNARMSTVEKDSMIRIPGENVSDADLMNIVLTKPRKRLRFLWN